IATRNRYRLSGVESDPHTTRKLGGRHESLQLDRSPKSLPGGCEVSQGLVAAKLEKDALMRFDGLCRELREAFRESPRRFIAVLVGVCRVPAYVGDQKGAMLRRPCLIVVSHTPPDFSRFGRPQRASCAGTDGQAGVEAPKQNNRTTGFVDARSRPA